MSDQPQHPGWWQASDGKWYPPQPATRSTPPQAEPPAAPVGGIAPAAPLAPKKRRTGLIIGLAAGGAALVLLLVVVAAILVAGSDDAVEDIDTGIFAGDTFEDAEAFVDKLALPAAERMRRAT